ncbi:hypothetical protein PIB30_069672 [Stylosanthes scabra]|uniref:Uncharacterized protein n=1 Tax=Stylosanthes scabra TaxID=79078 RepID=A0ABU6RNT3_9FABA|nr:hypothetical protein [Stylosanthes scabra]
MWVLGVGTPGQGVGNASFNFKFLVYVMSDVKNIFLGVFGLCKHAWSFLNVLRAWAPSELQHGHTGRQ